MTKISFFIALISFLFIICEETYAQGCSDAGFCTISSIKPNENDSTPDLNNQIKVGMYLGNADHSISAYGAYIEYDRAINDKLDIEVKLTSIGQTSVDFSTYGVSDLFVNGSYSITDSLKVIVGAKIPLSLANKTNNDLPLPMDYQSSLGTFDLIFGIGYTFKGVQFIAAIQQPLTQNENAFLSNSYPEDSPFRAFQSTNNYKRSGDVLLRISYPISIGNKFKLTPSLLPIYHLANDSYTDELNMEREIQGSQGLTLNGNLYFDYEINKKSAIQLNTGFPFIVRESRPDGLTRSFIANLEYRIRF